MKSSIPEPATELAIWGGVERERDSLSYFTMPQVGKWRDLEPAARGTGISSARAINKFHR
jgi:hypothetical protein